MTALLSPAEQAETTRFGIHDLDILADMEEHADDILPCEICLDQEAAWRIRMRCCGDASLLCVGCRNRLHEITRAKAPGARYRCAHCKHRFPVDTSLADLFVEVPL